MSITPPCLFVPSQWPQGHKTEVCSEAEGTPWQLQLLQESLGSEYDHSAQAPWVTGQEKANPQTDGTVRSRDSCWGICHHYSSLVPTRLQKHIWPHNPWAPGQARETVSPRLPVWPVEFLVCSPTAFWTSKRAPATGLLILPTGPPSPRDESLSLPPNRSLSLARQAAQ